MEDFPLWSQYWVLPGSATEKRLVGYHWRVSLYRRSHQIECGTDEKLFPSENSGSITKRQRVLVMVAGWLQVLPSLPTWASALLIGGGWWEHIMHTRRCGCTWYFALLWLGKISRWGTFVKYKVSQSEVIIKIVEITITVRMKSLTIFSGELHLLHHFRSDFAHLLGV